MGQLFPVWPELGAVRLSCITFFWRTLLPWSVVYFHPHHWTVWTGAVGVALSSKMAIYDIASELNRTKVKAWEWIYLLMGLQMSSITWCRKSHECYRSALREITSNWQWQSESTWTPWMKSFDSMLFLLNYSLGTSSTVKILQGSWGGQIYDFQGSSELGDLRRHRKLLANGWPAVKLTKGTRNSLVHEAMDNDLVSLTKNAKNLGVYQIYVQRVFKWEGLKYKKRKFTKVDSWLGRRPDRRSLVGRSGSGCLQSHQPLSRLK